MNRIALAAALSLSSLIAPIAAHADGFHNDRDRGRVEMREEGGRVVMPPSYVAPVMARPVFAHPMFARQTVAVRHVNHEGWRMQRAHEIRSGRARFEHGRW